MRVIYNGVDLGVLETLSFATEAVYDDTMTDYLFTRVSFAVRALVNGQAAVVTGGAPGPPMSYGFTGAPGPLAPSPIVGTRPLPPSVAPPTMPAGAGIAVQPPAPLRTITRTPFPPTTTHIAIRHRLETPRGKLWVFDGPGMESGTPAAGTPGAPGPTSRVMLESPLPRAVCDCKNGPIPKVLDIATALGDAATFIVDFSCETYINEGPLNAITPAGALLSNRFKQRQTVDESGYMQITTEGTAIYRTDGVYLNPNSPDADRPVLFMPIPQGFTRVIDYVIGKEDVTGVDYSYTDTQVPVNFTAGPYVRAAKISCVHRQAVVSNTDLLGGALGAYERYLNIRWSKKAGDDEPDTKEAKRKAVMDPLKAFNFTP
jgi:hypothetical protein